MEKKKNREKHLLLLISLENEGWEGREINGVFMEMVKVERVKFRGGGWGLKAGKGNLSRHSTGSKSWHSPAQSPGKATEATPRPPQLPDFG